MNEYSESDIIESNFPAVANRSEDAISRGFHDGISSFAAFHEKP